MCGNFAECFSGLNETVPQAFTPFYQILFRKELQTADEVAICGRCMHKSKTSITLALTSAPVFVHLRRFDGSGKRRVNPASFPLQTLILPLAAAQTSTNTYDCVAVSKLCTNQYTTFAKRDSSNSWFYCEDASASTVSRTLIAINIENPRAYFLFFIRRA